MRPRGLYRRQTGAAPAARPCAVDGCPREGKGTHGLCTVCYHNSDTRIERYGADPIALGVRLDFLKITGGACRRADGQCDVKLCRWSLLTSRPGRQGGHKSGVVQRRLPVLHETCVLDAADRGGMSLDEIGERLGLTRERVRQIEVAAIAKLKRAAERKDLAA